MHDACNNFSYRRNAKALYDCEAEDEQELTFRKGELLCNGELRQVVEGVRGLYSVISVLGASIMIDIYIMALLSYSDPTLYIARKRVWCTLSDF